MKTVFSAKLVLALGGVVFFLFLASCGGGSGTQQVDTPVSGRIKVSIDDSYRLMMEAEVFAFETIYPNTRIDTMYKSEADVIEDLMNDSVPLVFVSRDLTAAEKQYLNDRQYIPKTTKIAYDAVAFIVNRDNPDTSFFYQKIREIFEGKITTWKQLNPKSRLSDIKVIFDNYKSGNPRYFREKFGIDSLPPTCYAVQTNAGVIDFVEKNANAIGIISVNWISDREDTVSNNFLKRVKVAGIALEGDNDPSTKFYRPYQAYIAEESYPFTRTVYCINRQPYRGLAFGFSAFVAGEKGQRIILRSGMVPAAMPVRIVEIKK
jgi:phosphate transport system substrate-binding protein